MKYLLFDFYSRAEAASTTEGEGQTFTLLNSFWFMIASLLQQGTDLLPRYAKISVTRAFLEIVEFFVKNLNRIKYKQFCGKFGSTSRIFL